MVMEIFRRSATEHCKLEVLKMLQKILKGCLFLKLGDITMGVQIFTKGYIYREKNI